MDSGNCKNTFRYVEPKIGQLKGEINSSDFTATSCTILNGGS